MKHRKSIDASPKVILCAGLKSSGSTWLYNVVIAILKERHRDGVMAFYADNFAMFPPDTERARFLVIKTHEPSSALVYLMRITRGLLFVSVREPRDAIASLLQRFGHSYEGALKETRRQAARAAEMVRQEKAQQFRYEDGFTDRSETVGEIANILGVRLSVAARDRIYRSLTRGAVKKKIGALRRQGKFGAKPNSDSFDPKTHWHPGHVGNGCIGKYKSILTAVQQKRILDATRIYRAHFGYFRARKR